MLQGPVPIYLCNIKIYFDKLQGLTKGYQKQIFNIWQIKWIYGNSLKTLQQNESDYPSKKRKHENVDATFIQTNGFSQKILFSGEQNNIANNAGAQSYGRV